MALTIMLVPANADAVLTEISLGLVGALRQHGLSVDFFSPIEQMVPSSKIKNKIAHVTTTRDIEEAFSKKRFQSVLEDIAVLHQELLAHTDVIVVEGMQICPDHFYAPMLNVELAHALDAQVVVVANVDKREPWVIDNLLGVATNIYRARRITNRVIGCVLDKIDAKPDYLTNSAKIIATIPKTKRPKQESSIEFIDFIAKQFSESWLQELTETKYPQHLSMAIFRARIIGIARSVKRKILLPEGTEPRILRAARTCANRRLAHCILLGNPSDIKRVAKQEGIELPEDRIEIIDPDKIREDYIAPMVERRKNKGLTPKQAAEALQSDTILATMMLQEGVVDGMVSGVVHTTADTIRPALQLIKTVPGVKLVSSIFFICLPEQVLAYGDCAINPDPNAEELSDIAIASADSAKAFGINPKVAMISYSTGNSGFGPMVDKVRQATELVREKRPDILIDGPMQYDAAVDKTVASIKAPDSHVAGDATVFIFPDLNTGNALYKAVQRSTPGVLAIGPMLQGLNKPVNDLSRGALVEDIVFTIALTAVQSTH